MKIKTILRQHRRDFTAIMVCEGCGHEEDRSGYDDRNYHDNVIPNIKCSKCGESSKTLGVETQYVATKYPEGMQI